MAEVAGVDTKYKFDIIEFARGILQEVDSIRAYKESNDKKTSQISRTPIESRVNAFFRLIGLPSFVTLQSINKSKKSSQKGQLNGQRVLTPGFHKGERAIFSNYTIQDADSVGLLDVAALLSTREAELQANEALIGTAEMNRRMTLALAHSLPIQPNYPDTVGSGSFGNKSKREVFKKLFPLITHYINVIPVDHNKAKPFLPDAERAQIIPTEEALPKPFIETVIRIRLLETDSANSQAGNQKTADYEETLKVVFGDEVFNEVFKGNGALSQANVLEQFILDKLLSSVSQMANKWVQLRRTQDKELSKLPVALSVKATSAKLSPLGKRTEVSTDIGFLENSETGRLLSYLRKLIAQDEAFLSLLPTDETANSTAVRAQTKNVAKSALTNPFTSILNGDLLKNKERLAKLETEVKKYLSKMEKLRLELEMMTGEFTGLSVVDVVAVVIGLFLITKQDLVALLDKDTQVNMANEPGLKSGLAAAGITASPNAEQTANAVLALETEVERVFTLFHSQVRAIRNKALRNSKLRNNSKKVSRTPSRTRSLEETNSAVADRAGEE